MKVKDKDFYNGECQITSEENIKKAKDFLNGLAEYMDKRN